MRKYYKYEINMTIGNIVSILVLVLAAIPLLFLEMSFDFELKSFGIVLIAYIFWMLFHEILHALGHMVCGVKPKHISFGVALEKGVAFCLIRKEVSKKGILVSLIFPFFFIGVLTYIIGIIINSPLLIILSVFNIGGASIDLLMFYHFSKLGSDITYIEPGDGTSFYLMSNNEIKKLFGFNKIEEGTYTDNMFKNIKYKRIDISKVSAVLLIFLILFSILLLFL